MWGRLVMLLSTVCGHQLQKFIDPPGGAVIVETEVVYCLKSAVLI